MPLDIPTKLSTVNQPIDSDTRQVINEQNKITDQDSQRLISGILDRSRVAASFHPSRELSMQQRISRSFINAQISSKTLILICLFYFVDKLTAADLPTTTSNDHGQGSSIKESFGVTGGGGMLSTFSFADVGVLFLGGLGIVVAVIILLLCCYFSPILQYPCALLSACSRCENPAHEIRIAHQDNRISWMDNSSQIKTQLRNFFRRCAQARNPRSYERVPTSSEWV